MSNPVQLPCASGMPKPGSAGFEPQTRKPFCLTLFSVACPEAPVAARLAVKPKAIATPESFMVELQPYALKSLSKVAEAVLERFPLRLHHTLQQRSSWRIRRV